MQAAEQRGGDVCLLSPMDVILSDDAILQPDLLYVAKKRRDRVQKLALCAEYGVTEFWIVDHAAQWIEFLLLKEGAYVVTQPIEGRYQSPRLPEVDIDLASFWKNVAERLPQKN